ncbi:MAG: DUF1015 domain-containing protein [Clostridia bacterium]|nr:DUF1015 domain-containing protein [Clostridia bacterium]
MDHPAFFDSFELLLPDFSKIDGSKWSVVACDQFTSEPAYWKAVEKTVGSAPSTLSLVLPEVYLSERANRIPKIHSAMEEAQKSLLHPIPDAMIALERTQSDGRVRRGIVGLIDLETYEFKKGAASLIRATEGTVEERIRPRVEIRRNAPLELPHVLLLVDDPKKTVIEPAVSSASKREALYDFPLMLGGGHVKGWLLTKEEQKKIQRALALLADPVHQKELYGDGIAAPLLFAVGDGNHSLATAKTVYEEIKAGIGAEAAKKHPARYALCEIENLHDDALSFEPIYRVVFDCDPEALLTEFSDYANALDGNAAPQTLTALQKGKATELVISHPVHHLTVGTLQTFLDVYCKHHPDASVDYIHGEESLRSLAAKENAIGFLFDGMKKEELFQSVIFDGALPKKTFSMGQAHDKRYYLECRKIK